MAIPKLTDMAVTPEEAEEKVQDLVAAAPGKGPRYPWGLCISLCDDELEKLGIDLNDCSVGDMIHLFAMAKVTSKSCSESADGKGHCRLELQITHLGFENEDDEDERMAAAMERMQRRYGNPPSGDDEG